MKLTFKKASDKPLVEIKDADTLAVGESVTWNTSDENCNPKKFKGLMDGEYIFEEVTAPKAYEKAEPKTVIIETGNISIRLFYKPRCGKFF